MKMNASDADSAMELNRPDSRTLSERYESDISRYFRNAYIELIWKWHVYFSFADVEIRYVSDIWFNEILPPYLYRLFADVNVWYLYDIECSTWKLQGIVSYSYHSGIGQYICQISLWHRVVDVVSTSKWRVIEIDPTSVAISALHKNDDI